MTDGSASLSDSLSLSLDESSIYHLAREQQKECVIRDCDTRHKTILLAGLGLAKEAITRQPCRCPPSVDRAVAAL